MKRKILGRLNAFFTLSYLDDNQFVTRQFNELHTRYQADTPDWYPESTGIRLKAAFWIDHVATHFVFILGLSIGLIWPFTKSSEFIPGALIVVAMISFVVLYFFNYLPTYHFHYLPAVDRATKMHIEQQLHNNKEAFIAQMRRPKKEQLSNFGVVLVFYALDKTAGWNYLQCNRQSAELLSRLTGKDITDLQKKLALLYTKKTPVSPRSVTEIQNQFSEAIAFLREIGLEDAVSELQQLERNYHN